MYLIEVKCWLFFSFFIRYNLVMIHFLQNFMFQLSTISLQSQILCQFFLILTIFSKKVLQFYGSTSFQEGIWPGIVIFHIGNLFMCFSTKKTVLKPFFHLALAVIFCLRPFCHRNLSRLKSLHINPIVRVFIEGLLSLRVSSIYMCLKICYKLLVFH